MADGKPNAAISNRIVVSEWTVKKHIRGILNTLRPQDPEPMHRRVLALMADGKTDAASAGQIFVSEWTVKKHIRGILSKLRPQDPEPIHPSMPAVLTFLRLGEDDR